MPAPIHFTDADFQMEVLQSDIPVLVDFWAEWCGPCKAIAPIIEELANEYVGKVKIGKVDVDSNQGVATQLMVRSIPTLMIFHGGQVADSIIGAVPKGKIVEKLDRVLTQ